MNDIAAVSFLFNSFQFFIFMREKNEKREEKNAWTSIVSIQTMISQIILLWLRWFIPMSLHRSVSHMFYRPNVGGMHSLKCVMKSILINYYQIVLLMCMWRLHHVFDCVETVSLSLSLTRLLLFSFRFVAITKAIWRF